MFVNLLLLMLTRPLFAYKPVGTVCLRKTTCQREDIVDIVETEKANQDYC